MKERAYQLYYKKEEGIIEIKILKGIFERYKNELDDSAHWYNNCYYFSKNRNTLKELGLSIKNQWIEEATKDLEKFKNIKI